MPYLKAICLTIVQSPIIILFPKFSKERYIYIYLYRVGKKKLSNKFVLLYLRNHSVIIYRICNRYCKGNFTSYRRILSISVTRWASYGDSRDTTHQFALNLRLV